MKSIIAIVLALLPAVVTVLRAQPAAALGKLSVLIMLRQPEGALGKRLAEAPASTPVPDEVRKAALREQTSLVAAQKESFEQRLMAAGATGVVHFPALNMLRAEIPQSALGSLHSDPAVVSVTPLSEDAQAVVTGEVIASPSATLGVAVPAAAGVAAGRRGRKSEAFQSPSLMNGVPATITAATPATAPNPAFMPAMQMPVSQTPSLGTIPQAPMMAGTMMPGTTMPGAMMPGGVMPGGMMPGAAPMMGSPSFGIPSPAYPGAGGMFQSLLGVTGQMGMQAGTIMPRAAGMVTLFTGAAQIAQIVVSSRKQEGCAILLATVGTQVPEAGGQGVIAVNAPPSCLWQAQSDSDWLQINTPDPMMGPGIVKYTAAPASAGMLRSGVVSIAGVAGFRVKGKASTTVRQGR